MLHDRIIMSHRQADIVALRLLLTEAGAKDKDLPDRRLVSKAVVVVYDCVLQRLHSELRKASAFSLVFDGWTARGLRNAYIAILYSWIATIEVFLSLFYQICFSYDNVNIDRSCWTWRILVNDAYSMALLIASRVESHTAVTVFVRFLH
jgi:hypothetical protein